MRTVRACAVVVVWLAGCAGTADDPMETGPHEHSDAAQAVEADAEDDFKGCPEGIAVFEPGVSAAGSHFSMSVVAAMPEEPQRYINSWTVQLSLPDGSRALDAEIVRGQTFMPVHGHDGRLEPKPMTLSEPGQFEVDRLNFTMRGPWEVRFWLRSASVNEDYVVFKVCVAK